MSSCKHLASNLKSFLLDDKTERVNMNGLLTFDVDLQQCELFASATPVKDFPPGMLEMTFIELRQMTDLFLVTDWEVSTRGWCKNSEKSHESCYKVPTKGVFSHRLLRILKI